MHDNDWRALANCRETDPDTMQPEVASPRELEVAMSLCDGCPVRGRCTSLALSQPGGAYGIHGGKWYGDPPRNPELVQCGWCGEDMEPGKRGTRTYCSGACRVAAHRAAEALSA